jgi:hypothetical protein
MLFGRLQKLCWAGIIRLFEHVQADDDRRVRPRHGKGVYSSVPSHIFCRSRRNQFCSTNRSSTATAEPADPASSTKRWEPADPASSTKRWESADATSSTKHGGSASPATSTKRSTSSTAEPVSTYILGHGVRFDWNAVCWCFRPATY